jgi:hypothetical protein
MGCSRSRKADEGSYESQTMEKAEKLIGFANHTADAVDYAFRKVVNGDVISTNGWAWLISTVGVKNGPVIEKFR